MEKNDGSLLLFQVMEEIKLSGRNSNLMCIFQPPSRKLHFLHNTCMTTFARTFYFLEYPLIERFEVLLSTGDLYMTVNRSLHGCHADTSAPRALLRVAGVHYTVHNVCTSLDTLT